MDVLATLFAAIAAVAALVAIWQARRTAEANERSQAARERWQDEERLMRQLAQLREISRLVERVRKTADEEASPDGKLLAVPNPDLPFRFIWNAQRQLEAAVLIYYRLGGSRLEACELLGVDPGHVLIHRNDFTRVATDAFEEIAHASGGTT